MIRNRENETMVQCRRCLQFLIESVSRVGTTHIFFILLFFVSTENQWSKDVSTFRDRLKWQTNIWRNKVFSNFLWWGDIRGSPKHYTTNCSSCFWSLVSLISYSPVSDLSVKTKLGYYVCCGRTTTLYQWLFTNQLFTNHSNIYDLLLDLSVVFLLFCSLGSENPQLWNCPFILSLT